MDTLQQIWSNRQDCAGPCERCPGCDAPYPFYGIGDEDADIMLVGIEPAYNIKEEHTGIGLSWDTAQTMMELDRKQSHNPLWRVMKRIGNAAGQSAEELYFTNVAKCGGSKDSRTERIEHCTDYLEQEIQQVDPDLILVFGSDATEEIKKLAGLGSTNAMKSEHGTLYKTEEADIIPFYHWGYAARNGDQKVWNLFVEKKVQDYDNA